MFIQQGGSWSSFNQRTVQTVGLRGSKNLAKITASLKSPKMPTRNLHEKLKSGSVARGRNTLKPLPEKLSLKLSRFLLACVGTFLLPALVWAATTVGTGITTDSLIVDTDTFYVDAGNNRVGIGTTSPSTKLHVTGNALFQNTTDTATAFQILDTDGGNPIVNIDTVDEKIYMGGTEPLYAIAGGATDRMYIQNGDFIIERDDGISPQIKFKANTTMNNGLVAFKDLGDDNQWVIQSRASDHPTESKEFKISQQYDGGAWYDPFTIKSQSTNETFTIDTTGVMIKKSDNTQLTFNSNGVGNTGVILFQDTGDNQKWLFSARASDHASEARQFKITEHNQGTTWYDPFTIMPESPNNSLVIDPAGIGIDTASPTEKLDVNSDTIRLRTAKTPASATATCDQGEIVWDTNFIYICVATNSWKRSAIAAW